MKLESTPYAAPVLGAEEQNTAADDNGLTPVPSGTVATEVHGTIWYKDERAGRIPTNRLVPERDFAIWTLVGDVITHGSDQIRKYSRLDCFLLMLPPDELRLIVTLTNSILQKEKKKETNVGEVLKLFSIWVLTIQFDF